MRMKLYMVLHFILIIVQKIVHLKQIIIGSYHYQRSEIIFFFFSRC